MVSQASQLTGSTTGGIVIGLVGALVGGLFDQQAAEARQLPGVATAFVEVTLPDGSYGFSLKAAADNTDDIQEKIALLEAADFLSLPSIDFTAPASPRTPEQIQADAQRRAESKARRQAQMQNRAGKQDPQSPPDQNPSPAPNQ